MPKDENHKRYAIVVNGETDYAPPKTVVNDDTLRGYASYAVVTKEGTFTCAFFGGGSLAAAQLWADYLNSLPE